MKLIILLIFLLPVIKKIVLLSGINKEGYRFLDNNLGNNPRTMTKRVFRKHHVYAFICVLFTRDSTTGIRYAKYLIPGVDDQWYMCEPNPNGSCKAGSFQIIDVDENKVTLNSGEWIYNPTKRGDPLPDSDDCPIEAIARRERDIRS